MKVSVAHVMVKEVLLECPCMTSTTTVTLNCSHINGQKIINDVCFDNYILITLVYPEYAV
jgi:hypothetical protein